MGFVAGAMSFGVQNFLPLQFQDANFVKPTMAGLYLAPLMAGVMLGSTGGGFLTAKTGRYKFVPVIGLGISVLGTASISQISSSWGFLVLMIPMLAIGTGNGGTFTTTSIATQNAIDPKVLGVGTATLVSFRYLGRSLALAAYGSVFTSTVSSNLQRNLPPGALPNGTKVSSLVRTPEEIKSTSTRRSQCRRSSNNHRHGSGVSLRRAAGVRRSGTSRFRCPNCLCVPTGPMSSDYLHRTSSSSERWRNREAADG